MQVANSRRSAIPRTDGFDQVGLSEEEVIEILGPPTSTKNIDRKVGTWRSHHAGGFKSLDVPAELREKSVTRELKWKVGKLTLVIDFLETRVADGEKAELHGLTSIPEDVA